MKPRSDNDSYGLMGEFERPEDVLAAARAVRQAGYTKMDAYTPFPVHGLEAVVAISKSLPLQLLVLLGGIAGALGGFGMQYFASVIHYPMNVGGRPLNSWPAFIPITFETTILAAALTAVFGMLALNKLPMPYHPCFHIKAFERATQDRFFLCVKRNDPRYDEGELRRLMQAHAALALYEVPR